MFAKNKNKRAEAANTAYNKRLNVMVQATYATRYDRGKSRQLEAQARAMLPQIRHT